MAQWEYRIETVHGVFKPRSRKLSKVRRICKELGADGWELVSVSYDWFVVRYELYFKRAKAHSV